MDDQAGATNAEENEAIEREEIEAMQLDEIEPNVEDIEGMDSFQIEPMHREEIEPNEHQLVITSAPPQPEEKKNKGKRKKPMADAENIPARITRSKVVNPANNTRSKKKI